MICRISYWYCFQIAPQISGFRFRISQNARWYRVAFAKRCASSGAGWFNMTDCWRRQRPLDELETVMVHLDATSNVQPLRVRMAMVCVYDDLLASSRLRSRREARAVPVTIIAGSNASAVVSCSCQTCRPLSEMLKGETFTAESQPAPPLLVLPRLHLIQMPRGVPRHLLPTQRAVHLPMIVRKRRFVCVRRVRQAMRSMPCLSSSQTPQVRILLRCKRCS